MDSMGQRRIPNGSESRIMGQGDEVLLAVDSFKHSIAFRILGTHIAPLFSST
jgi:hypothetical protein